MFKSFKSWLFVLVGLAALFLGHVAEPLADSHFQGKDVPSFISRILANDDQLQFWGIFLIAVTFSVEYLSSKLAEFFTKSVTPIIDKHVEELSQSLETISATTRTMLSERLIESIVNSSDQETVKKQLKNIHAKAYGEHCAADQGFYTAINQKYLPFLERNKPHRSEYQQTVTVVEHGPDSIKWHEVCTYKIHTIGHDLQYGATEREGIKHKIKFSTTVEASKLTFDGDDPFYSLILKVNDEILFDSKDHLVIGDTGAVEVKDNSMNWLEVSHIANSLTISISKNHEIREAWTNIEIIESSTITDDYFISRRNEPTYGANININLPDGWYFEHIAFGHPEDWNIHQHPVNTLSANTRTWLLPGITFFCKWKRPSQSELPLDG